jgi:hypothetical protein
MKTSPGVTIRLLYPLLHELTRSGGKNYRDWCKLFIQTMSTINSRQPCSFASSSQKRRIHLSKKSSTLMSSHDSLVFFDHRCRHSRLDSYLSIFDASSLKPRGLSQISPVEPPVRPKLSSTLERYLSSLNCLQVLKQMFVNKRFGHLETSPVIVQSYGTLS